MNFKMNNMSLVKAEGFFLQKLNKFKVVYNSIIMFKCKGGSFIMSEFVCNKEIDCPHDNSDEENCICKVNMKKPFCKYTKVGNHKKACNHLYYTTHSGQCCKYNSFKSINKYTHSRITDMNDHCYYPYSQSNTNLIFTKHLWKTTRQSNGFICNSGQIIDKLLLDDIIPDCGQNAEDEPMLKLLLSETIYHSCKKPEERPCMIGHNKCYNITDVCIYRLNIFHHITPCRNGSTPSTLYQL